MTGPETFEEPTDLVQADALRAQLTNDVQSIQAQLGDKQRTDDDGNRLTSKEYWAWKKRAQHALNQKLDDLRVVKNWIREHRQEVSIPNSENEALGHLRNLCNIITVLQGEDVEFESTETTQIAAAEKFLRHANKEHHAQVQRESTSASTNHSS